MEASAAFQPTLGETRTLSCFEMLVNAEVPAELIDAARLGEPGAGDRLLAQAWPHAFRIARSILRDAGLAEDAAQEACAIVHRSLAGLRSSAAFRVWFYRIVVREAARLDRKRALLSFFVREPHADAGLSETILRVDVLRALAALPRAQRAAVVLHYYAEMNSREIASVLRLPDSTVRFHLARARRSLETMLGDHRMSAVLREAAAGAR
jgi:RNA polymerase sigma-70 factor, ECF subfamily